MLPIAEHDIPRHDRDQAPTVSEHFNCQVIRASAALRVSLPCRSILPATYHLPFASSVCNLTQVAICKLKEIVPSKIPMEATGVRLRRRER
jgi:hypothetical protein